MKTEVISITPEMAKEMLSKNNTNRRIRNRRVSLYADQMKKGNWHLTGQTITIAKDGTLLDGQHRLSAIIEAGVPVEFLVVSDIDPAPTYDCGLPRSMTDRLYLSGINAPVHVLCTNGIAIVRFCMALEKYGNIDIDHRNFSTDDVINYIKENYEDIDWITHAVQLGSSGRYVRKAVHYGTLYSLYHLGVITKAEAEKFIAVLKSGMTSDEVDAPIIAYRNKVMSMRTVGVSGDKELFYRLCYAVMKWKSGSCSMVNKYTTHLPYDFTKLKKEENETDAKN